MKQRTFIICFIISLLSVYLNGSSYNSKLNDDNFNLYELFRSRKSSSFTSDQHHIQKQVLNAHNIYRSRHCAPPLVLDDDLNQSAQKYAEHLANTNTFEHSDLPELGENLFKMTSSNKIDDLDDISVQATRSWYWEIKSYDFKDPQFSDETGHFTQLVWKDTKKLGVGYATGKQKSFYTLYIVAHYSPGGNVKDMFSENVLAHKC